MENVRIDKWLWCVRLFKTRGLATDACRLNRVKLGSSEAKPSRTVQSGDVLSIETDGMTRTVKVLRVLEKRVGAKLVSEYLEDLTPAEEEERAKEIRAQQKANRVYNVPGEGRPRKKDRRRMTEFEKARAQAERDG